MKRYVIILVILVIALMFEGYRIYNQLQSTQASNVSIAIKRALEETNLTKANQSYYFTGPKSYHVIEGINEENNPIFVYVGEDEEEKIVQVGVEEGVTREEIERLTMVSYPDGEVLRVNPGILNNQFIWEVLSRSKADEKLQYIFYDFHSGAQMKSFKLPL